MDEFAKVNRKGSGLCPTFFHAENHRKNPKKEEHH